MTLYRIKTSFLNLINIQVKDFLSFSCYIVKNILIIFLNPSGEPIMENQKKFEQFINEYFQSPVGQKFLTINKSVGAASRIFDGVKGLGDNDSELFGSIDELRNIFSQDKNLLDKSFQDLKNDLPKIDTDDDLDKVSGLSFNRSFIKNIDKFTEKLLPLFFNSNGEIKDFIKEGMGMLMFSAYQAELNPSQFAIFLVKAMVFRFISETQLVIRRQEEHEQTEDNLLYFSAIGSYRTKHVNESLNFVEKVPKLEKLIKSIEKLPATKLHRELMPFRDKIVNAKNIQELEELKIAILKIAKKYPSETWMIKFITYEILKAKLNNLKKGINDVQSSLEMEKIDYELRELEQVYKGQKYSVKDILLAQNEVLEIHKEYLLNSNKKVRHQFEKLLKSIRDINSSNDYAAATTKSQEFEEQFKYIDKKFHALEQQVAKGLQPIELKEAYGEHYKIYQPLIKQLQKALDSKKEEFGQQGKNVLQNENSHSITENNIAIIDQRKKPDIYQSNKTLIDSYLLLNVAKDVRVLKIISQITTDTVFQQQLQDYIKSLNTNFDQLLIESGVINSPDDPNYIRKELFQTHAQLNNNESYQAIKAPQFTSNARFEGYAPAQVIHYLQNNLAFIAKENYLKTLDERITLLETVVKALSEHSSAEVRKLYQSTFLELTKAAANQPNYAKTFKSVNLVADDGSPLKMQQVLQAELDATRKVAEGLKHYLHQQKLIETNIEYIKVHIINPIIRNILLKHPHLINNTEIVTKKVNSTLTNNYSIDQLNQIYQKLGLQFTDKELKAIYDFNSKFYHYISNPKSDTADFQFDGIADIATSQDDQARLNQDVLKIKQAYQQNLEVLNKKISQLNILVSEFEVVNEKFKSSLNNLKQIQKDDFQAQKLSSSLQEVLSNKLKLNEFLKKISDVNDFLRITVPQGSTDDPLFQQVKKLQQKLAVLNIAPTIELNNQELDKARQAIEEKLKHSYYTNLHDLLNKLTPKEKIILVDNEFVIKNKAKLVFGKRGTSKKTVSAYGEFLSAIEQSIHQGTPDKILLEKLLATDWSKNILENNSSIKDRVMQMRAELIAHYINAVNHISQTDFAKVTSKELLKPSKYGDAKECPNLFNCAKHFNQLSQQVRYDILAENNLDMVTQRTSFWIEVAHGCYKSGNFSGMQAIISALNSTDIYRLLYVTDNTTNKNSEGVVLKGIPEHVNVKLNELKQITQADNSLFTNMRKAMEEHKGATIPYLGIYQTVLTFAKDKNTNVELTSVPEAKAAITVIEHMQNSLSDNSNEKNELANHLEVMFANHALKDNFEEQQYALSKQIIKDTSDHKHLKPSKVLHRLTKDSAEFPSLSVDNAQQLNSHDKHKRLTIHSIVNQIGETILDADLQPTPNAYHIDEWEYTAPDSASTGTSGKLEIRYFNRDSYHLVKVEDFIVRANSLYKAAILLVNSSESDDLSKKDLLTWLEHRKNFIINQLRNDCSLEPEKMRSQDRNEYFKKRFKLAEGHLKQFVYDMAYAINNNTKKDIEKIYKAFSKAETTIVTQEGRSNLLHIYPIHLPNGTTQTAVSASQTMGSITYPSTDRKQKIPANFIKTTIGHVNEQGEFISDMQAYRHSSPIPIAIAGPRIAIPGTDAAKLNTERKIVRREASYQQMLNVLEAMTRETLTGKNLADYQNQPLVLNIATMTLLTPNKGDGLRGPESETRQLRETYMAYQMVRNQALHFNIDGVGVKVKVNIDHMNGPANSLMRYPLDSLQEQINYQGFVEFTENFYNFVNNSFINVVNDPMVHTMNIQAVLNQIKQFADNYNKDTGLSRLKADLENLKEKFNLPSKYSNLQIIQENYIEALAANDAVKQEKLADEYEKKLAEIRDNEEVLTSKYKVINTYLTKVNKEQLSNIYENIVAVFQDNKVKDYLKSEEGKSIKALLNVVQLYLDCKELYHSGKYLKQEYGYQLQSRFIAANTLMNSIPVWFCKSAEDRTGALQISIESYYIFMREMGYFPTIKTSENISDLEKIALEKAHEFSISREITTQNAPGARGLQQTNSLGNNKYLDVSTFDSPVGKIAKGILKTELLAEPSQRFNPGMRTQLGNIIEKLTHKLKAAANKYQEGYITDFSLLLNATQTRFQAAQMKLVASETISSKELNNKFIKEFNHTLDEHILYYSNLPEEDKEIANLSIDKFLSLVNFMASFNDDFVKAVLISDAALQIEHLSTPETKLAFEKINLGDFNTVLELENLFARTNIVGVSDNSLKAIFNYTQRLKLIKNNFTNSILQKILIQNSNDIIPISIENNLKEKLNDPFVKFGKYQKILKSIFGETFAVTKEQFAKIKHENLKMALANELEALKESDYANILMSSAAPLLQAGPKFMQDIVKSIQAIKPHPIKLLLQKLGLSFGKKSLPTIIKELDSVLANINKHKATLSLLAKLQTLHKTEPTLLNQNLQAYINTHSDNISQQNNALEKSLLQLSEVLSYVIQTISAEFKKFDAVKRKADTLINDPSIHKYAEIYENSNNLRRNVGHLITMIETIDRVIEKLKQLKIIDDSILQQLTDAKQAAESKLRETSATFAELEPIKNNLEQAVYVNRKTNDDTVNLNVNVVISSNHSSQNKHHLSKLNISKLASRIVTTASTSNEQIFEMPEHVGKLRYKYDILNKEMNFYPSANYQVADKAQQISKNQQRLLEDMAARYILSNPQNVAFLRGEDKICQKTAVCLLGLNKDIQLYINDKLFKPTFGQTEEIHKKRNFYLKQGILSGDVANPEALISLPKENTSNRLSLGRKGNI